MKDEERVVCHFFRENWPCKVGRQLPAASLSLCFAARHLTAPGTDRHSAQVMDKHLEILASKHFETKFIKVRSVARAWEVCFGDLV